MNFKVKSALSVVVISLTSFACSKPSTQTADSSLAAKAVSESQGADKVTSCVRTEPFWNISIGKDLITFDNNGTEQVMSIKNTGPKSSIGHMAEYAALYQGRVLETVQGEKFLNIIIKKSNGCSDGMSDTVYPFEVSVLSGTSLHLGCCR